MVNFDRYPRGKDQEDAPGIELDGKYYPNLDLMIALARALIKKGVIRKADIMDELAVLT